MELLLSLKKTVPEDLWKNFQLSVQVESRIPMMRLKTSMITTHLSLQYMFFLSIVSFLSQHIYTALASL